MLKYYYIESKNSELTRMLRRTAVPSVRRPVILFNIGQPIHLHMDVRKMAAENRETVLYLAFGALTTFISWGTYSLFVLLGIDLNISNIMSWICGVSFAFVTNKWFVFESKSTETTVVATELGSFIAGRVATGVLAIVMFSILIANGMGGVFFGIDGLPARIVTSLIEIILNWGISKYLVFTKKEPRPERTRAEREEEEELF